MKTGRWMNRESIYLAVTLIGALALMIAGAWSSPSFSEQQSYLEAISMFISLLFVFSVVVVVAAMGFHSFSIFMALFIAMAVSIYGAYAGIVVVSMSYLVWGLVFAIEALLADRGVEGAKRWFGERYDEKSFRYEYRVFYPMIWIFYFLLEYLPSLMTGERRERFDPDRLKRGIIDTLKKGR
jgi:hypothetical protein